MKRSQTATAGLTILFVTFVFFAQGQSLVNVVKPSPTVQAMQKFGDIPVSAYTGVPEITVPIYTIEFRDLKVPVSLNYHASGIKVSEEAGNVGLGWSLNAGGAVSRNIIGGDDLDGTTYLSSALPDLDSGITYQNRIQGGCILALVNAGPRPLPTLFNYDLTNVLGNDFPADFQPDQYYYNILGRSGKFTIRHNGQVLLEKQEKLDISLTSGGAGWQIKDQNGFIYDFTVFETYQSSAGTPQQHKSAWFLTQITSPTGNKVTFNYTALPLNPITPMGSSYEIRDVFQAVVDFGGVTYQPPTLGYRTGTNPVSTYYSQQLSSIDFTNGVVRFSYSGDRTDLPGAFKLDSVSVFSKDAQGNVSATPVRTTSLTYDYFFGETYPLNGSLQVNTQKGPTTTRLKLMSVKNTGYLNGQRTVDSPYTFSYYEKDPSLQPTKNSIARDHWGYYNGKNSNSSLIPSYNSYTSDDQVQTLVGTPGPERDTDTLYSKLFSLTSITYPTGGSTEFQMEANDYDPALSSVNDHSNFAYLESIVPEVSSTGYDGYNHRPYSDSIMDLSSEYYNVTNGAGTPVSINVTVRCASDDINLQLNTTDLIYVTFIGQDGGVVLTKDLGNLSTCGPGQTLACLSKSGPAYTYTYTNIYLPPQKYTVRTYVDNSLRNTVMDFLVDVHWSARISGNLLAEPSLGIRNYGYAGGLRARRIIDHDGIDSANDHVKRYVYHYTADKGNGLQEFTYGRRMSRPQYFYFEWAQGVHTEGIANYYYTSEHLMRSSDSDIPLNGSAGGSPVGYDQVTVLDGENGENGKTVYTYYNQPDDIYDYNSVNGLPHRPPVTSSTAYSLNGSLLQQVDYANTGGSFYKRREIINDYTLFPARQNTLNGFEMRVPLSDGTNQPATSGCSHILIFYTALQSQWNYQLDHEEKMYNGGIDTFNYIDNHTYYSYENPAHFLPTRSMTFNSKGDTVTTITKYPLDYANGGSSDAFSMGIIKLNTAHVVNAPVEVYKQINPLSGTPYVISGTITAYSTTLPKPVQGSRLDLQQTIGSFVPSSITGGITTKDPNYAPLISYDQYDNNGNLLQQHKVNDLNQSYVWGYNNSLPIAQVSNAAAKDIFYTSFEDADGNSTDGDSRTGKKSRTGGYSKSLSGLTNGAYVLTWWTKSAGQWSLLRQNVTVSGGAYTISLTGQVDEVRFYPRNALMTTYTYDPLIGRTSECDAGSKIIYYEYDGLGRLKIVRDQDRNIIKTVDYHYKGH